MGWDLRKDEGIGSAKTKIGCLCVMRIRFPELHYFWTIGVFHHERKADGVSSSR